MALPTQLLPSPNSRARIASRKPRPVPKIEIYTQPWCPYCARALNLLTEKGVDFQEIEAPGGSPERAEARRRAGGATSVPQIFIDGQHIGGSDELRALDRAGALDPLLAG
jgi:glutaredoxin 3